MPTLTDLARRLNLCRPAAAASASRLLPPLILMTDADRLPDPAAAVARLPRGSAVILRHYGVPGRDALARDLVALCRGRHIRVLIAADARLARAVGADGLHLPEAMARRGPGIWQRWRRPDWIVTAAAHSRAALFRAARAGADAALLSPVFWTASHPLAPALGPLRFAAWCRSSPLPVYALGGISARTARRLRTGGGAGFAGISGFTVES